MQIALAALWRSGYRAAGRGRPQHGRGRGGLRRRCVEPRRCGRGASAGGAVSSGPRSGTERWVRWSFLPRALGALWRGTKIASPSPQVTVPLRLSCTEIRQRSKRSSIDCSGRTSSAGCSESIPLPQPPDRALARRFVAGFEGLDPRPVTVPILSTVTGKLGDGTEFKPLRSVGTSGSPYIFDGDTATTGTRT